MPLISVHWRDIKELHVLVLLLHATERPLVLKEHYRTLILILQQKCVRIREHILIEVVRHNPARKLIRQMMLIK